MKKTEWQKEGFKIKNKSNEHGKVYFWLSEAEKYVPLTNELREKIVSGSIKLWNYLLIY